MRSITAMQTCLALLMAFAMAPFEHVHSGAGSDHDHPAIIHAHFFELHAHPDSGGEPAFDDDDDDHASAWQLDTFTLVVPAAWMPFVPSRGPVMRLTLVETAEPVIVVEERGHDPPSIDLFPPRPPPA